MPLNAHATSILSINLLLLNKINYENDDATDLRTFY